MNKSLKAIGFVAVFAIAVLMAKSAGCSPVSNAPNSAPSAAVAAANNGFCFRLIGELNKEDPDGNILISPFSVSSALSMTMNGAANSTRFAMASTLGLQGLALPDVNTANKALLDSLNSPAAGVQLSIANAIWADQGVSFSPAFQDACRDDYYADATTLDFNSPTAAAAINKWVSDKTEGHIDSIVQPTDLDPLGVVLTNAIYFHGFWKTPFDPKSTQPADFTLEDGTTEPVPMMSEYESFPYFETAAFQGASLPYGNGQMSMVILLPKNSANIASVVNSLDTGSWDRTVAGLGTAELHVELPKFDANYATDLTDSLKALGMGIAFNQGAADFSLMYQGEFIQKVVHKTTLDVDETGTVATAAIGVDMADSAAMDNPTPPTPFIVDHPFFYAIRDDNSSAILFAGIVRDPMK